MAVCSADTLHKQRADTLRHTLRFGEKKKEKREEGGAEEKDATFLSLSRAREAGMTYGGLPLTPTG